MDEQKSRQVQPVMMHDEREIAMVPVTMQMSGKSDMYSSTKSLLEEPAQQVEDDYAEYKAEGCIERGCHPILGCALKPAWFLVFLVIFSVVQTMNTTGLYGASTSSIQREVGLNGKQWGLVTSLYDAFVLVMTIVFSLPGKKTHRPRVLGLCFFLSGLGSLVFLVPHFYISGKGLTTIQQNNLYFCEDSSSHCTIDGNGFQRTSLIIFIFLIGQLLFAIGSSALWVQGPVYLDLNVSSKFMNIYLGILYSSAALGPAVGYLLAGKVLSIWVNAPFEEKPDDLYPDSSNWIGAWWMGYVLTFCLAMGCSLPFCCFPRFMPGTSNIRKEKENSTDLYTEKDTEIQRRAGFASKMKAALEGCLACMNKVFIFNCLGGAAESFAVSAATVFLPQIIEAQYGLSPSETSFAFGIVTVLGAASGIVFGGWFIFWRNYDGVKTARFCMIAALVALPFTFIFLLGCKTPTIIGFNDGSNLDVACNAGCTCDNTNAQLVCINEQTYFSMCHAGCLVSDSGAALDANLNGTSLDCGCIDTIDSIKQGYCKDKGCKKLIPFLCLTFFLMFATFANNVPAAQVILRSTSLENRSIAMGLHAVTYRLLGSIPGPLIVGTLLDKMCLLFDCTNDTCSLMDNPKVSLLMTIVVAASKIVSFICFLASWLFYKNKTKA